jgi:hypothetical protein
MRVLGVVALANLLFFVLQLITPAPSELVVERVQNAFVRGELTLEDYLPFDSYLGWHQYNDCVVLQMLMNDNPSQSARALAPIVYNDDLYGGRQCVVLYGLVTGTQKREELSSFRYARYWHGYNVTTGLGLRWMEIQAYRNLLKLVVLLAIGILVLAAFRSGPHARRATLVIALAAGTVWAVPYFAPGLTHGPGDALLLLAIAGLAVCPRIVYNFATLLPYTALFGAGVVYLEMLTGQLPVAAGWLVAMTLAAGRDGGRHAGGSTIAAVVGGLLAFGLGAIATIIVKQILALFLAEPDATGQFLSQLRFYMIQPNLEPGWPEVLEPFGRLARKTSTLTFGNQLAGYALVGAVGFAWLGAAVQAWRNRRSEIGRDLQLLLTAALIPVFWVLLFPYHTYIHASFMVRMLIVPISLVTLALLWPGQRHWQRRLQ